ncbi:MAG: hypothetical protein V7754_19980 [Halioglobus sp.]
MKNHTRRCRATISACVATVGLLSGQAMADNPGGWEYSVAPLYLWAKGIDGAASIGQLDAPLDLDFSDDILENLDSAFAIHIEAKQGDLTLWTEYNYAKLDPSAEAALGPVVIGADIEFQDTMFELGVAYVFADTGSTQWEVLGGVRYMDQEIDVEIDKPESLPLPLPDEISGGDDWWHGFGGFRVTTKLSERWSFRAKADLGYQDTDNRAVHAVGFFDYRFTAWGSFFAGYRYLDTEYDNGESGPDGYVFDADQQGPVLGLNFYF